MDTFYPDNPTTSDLKFTRNANEIMFKNIESMNFICSYKQLTVLVLQH